MVFRATAYHKKLQDAGFNDKQAAVMTESMEDFVLGEVVTRDYLDAKIAQVDAKFAQVDAKFAQVDAKFAQVDAKLSELEVRIIRWVVGMNGATLLAVLVALFRGAFGG